MGIKLGSEDSKICDIIRYLTLVWCCKLFFSTVYSKNPATFEGTVPQNIIILSFTVIAVAFVISCTCASGSPGVWMIDFSLSVII